LKPDYHLKLRMKISHIRSWPKLQIMTPILHQSAVGNADSVMDT